ARTASSSGTGSSADTAMSQPTRRGGRGASASAFTVLERAARNAGTRVARTATPSAAAVTQPIVATVIDGVPTPPIRPVLASARISFQDFRRGPGEPGGVAPWRLLDTFASTKARA